MTRVLALALALAQPGQSQPDTDDHVASEASPAAPDGATLFREGRYAEAAEAFAAEYEATKDPALLFGSAMALQRAGNCWAAIDGFEAFISRSPPATDVHEARKQIDSCRKVLEMQTHRPEPRVEAPPPPAPLPDRDTFEAPPWYRDPLGSALVGVGVPVMFAGGGLYGASFAVADGGARDSEADYERRRTQVRAMAITGITLLGVGAALTIVGTIRYGMLRRSRSSSVIGRAFEGAPGLRWSF
jgi:hypothetical protein